MIDPSTPAPKFCVGDKVRVNHMSSISWEGQVVGVESTGYEWEYWVTNSPHTSGGYPLLAWESEMELV